MIVIVGSAAVLVAVDVGPVETHGRLPMIRVRVRLPAAKP